MLCFDANRRNDDCEQEAKRRDNAVPQPGGRVQRDCGEQYNRNTQNSDPPARRHHSSSIQRRLNAGHIAARLQQRTAKPKCASTRSVSECGHNGRRASAHVRTRVQKAPKPRVPGQPMAQSSVHQTRKVPHTPLESYPTIRASTEAPVLSSRLSNSTRVSTNWSTQDGTNRHRQTQQADRAAESGKRERSVGLGPLRS